ncbi:hypothetical protein HK096_006770 [Nowakowskiella sp. JEL0078]|nr:hypothetical protein HK096_006770 [Nowakowskiella sp. JEL0078]
MNRERRTIPKHDKSITNLTKPRTAKKKINPKTIGQAVSDTTHFNILSDLIFPSETPFIIAKSNDESLESDSLILECSSLSFKTVSLLVSSAPLMFSKSRISRGDRVGIIVLNNVNFAMSLISVMSLCAAVPLNPSGTLDEIISELTFLRVKAVVVCSQKVTETGGEILKYLDRAKIEPIVLSPTSDIYGLFTLGSPKPAEDNNFFSEPNTAEDVALILRTSGTSGNKKTVTYTLRTLVVGALCVAKSWDLKPNDVNLNMMPLYHVGGIVRNLLAPLLSGSSVIITSGFDPVLFWDFLDLSNFAPTWYYAVPTMHNAILDEGRRRYPSGYPFKPNSLTRNKKVSFYVGSNSGHSNSMSRTGTFGRSKREGIRMICNAGAGMVPRLAQEMREFFGACILPSYGMTECMPITTPPIGYALERPGTSGISVGPEIAILGEDAQKKLPGEVGFVCVRGVPCFTGYEGDLEATEKSFTKDGWFNTGDMGYLDDEDYLYITGRSKEVINRGGEIISPVEIEEAVITHPSVKSCLAFVVPHEIFQESIGILIVTETDTPKIDLVGVQKHVASTLHPSKWPQVIVHMSDLPTNTTNKPLRINLANRLGIAKISDGIPVSARTYVAVCPSKTANIKDPIECLSIHPRKDVCLSVLKCCPFVLEAEVIQTKVGIDPNALLAYVAVNADKNVKVEDVTNYLSRRLDAYDVPSKIMICPGGIPRLPDGTLDILATRSKSNGDGVQRVVKRVFQHVLNLKDDVELFSETDFFFVGGDSLTAGKAAALFRKRLGVDFQPHVMFKTRTIESISLFISEKLPKDHSILKENFRHSRCLVSGERRKSTASSISSKSFMDVPEKKPKTVSATKSSSSNITLLIQSLPLIVLRPTRRILFFILLCLSLSINNFLVGLDEELLSMPGILLAELLVAIIIVTVFYVGIGLPLCGIFVKWAVVGRYRAGRYPLWSQYYLRWWIVDQVIRLCGYGFFNSNRFTMRMYLKLMGAKVGSSLMIDSLKHSNLREYDLIEIGNNCAFDFARVRPFTMDSGNMILQKIKIGNRCTVNISTVIAPGADIPSDTCFPPLSSSHEIKDANIKYQDICRTNLKGPNIFLKIIIGYPTIGLINAVSMIPWVASLYLLGIQKSNAEYNRYSSEFSEVVIFFSQIYRIAFKCLALIARDVVSPFVFMFMTIVVKRLILGLAKIDKPVTQWDLLRSWIMGKLLGDGSLGGLNKLIGKHYEYTSMIYRALGANIGSRIYWPGTGLCIGDHEFLTVGEDVVFGSRTHIITRNSMGRGAVVIEAGAMIADRCVLLPGVHVGRHTMLGTGSLGKQNNAYPAGSVWLGSKRGGAVLWDRGNEDTVNASTITPFGVAFYGKQANYSVIPMWLCMVYCVLITSLHVVVEFMPLLGAIQIGGAYFRLEANNENSEVIGALLMIGSYIVFSFVKSILVLAISILAKWVIHGRRKPGKYNWDESSYCQRWQILIAIQSTTSELLESIRGSFYIVLYFRLLGSQIGRNVCLYPTGADPMMTEADLVTIGDNVMIDNASVICHINSKGQFSLNPLVIREGASLRANSRLLSGAEMDEDAVLLEHTLILSGDIAAKGEWQGWPLSTEDDESDAEFDVAENNDKTSNLSSLTLNQNSLGSGGLENGFQTTLSKNTIELMTFSNENNSIQRGDNLNRGETLQRRRSSFISYLNEEDYILLRQRARGDWFEIDDRLADLHLKQSWN